MADADHIFDLACGIYSHLSSCYDTCLSHTAEKIAKERPFPNILLQPWGFLPVLWLEMLRCVALLRIAPHVLI